MFAKFQISKLNRLKFLFLYIALLFGNCVCAQQFNAYTPIESSNGLSENNVRGIAQLPDGRMVIMTEGMINLYNGSSFQYIHLNDEKIYPLPGYSGFHHTYVDNSGRFWIKRTGQLMLVDMVKERYEEHPEKILASLGVKEPLADFFMDAGKDLWMVTISGKLLYRDGKGNETITFIPKVTSLNSSDPLYDISVLDGHLYLFYRSGLVICYEMNSRKELYRQNALEGQTASAYERTAYVIPGNHALYMLRNGERGIMLAYDFKLRKWKKIIETDYWFNSFTIGKNGEIAISCKKGIWMTDPSLKAPQFLSTLHLVDGRSIDTEVSSIFYDRQGGLWVGTLNRGLLYYHPDRFRFRNIGNSLFPKSENEELYVTCFSEDDQGNVLVGTKKGLFTYSHHAHHLELFSSAMRTVTCNAMLRDHKNRIWVSTSSGLYSITGKTIHHYAIGNINSLLPAPDGTFYGSTELGLVSFDPATGIHKRIESSGEKETNPVRQAVWWNHSLIGISSTGLIVYHPGVRHLETIPYNARQKLPMFRHNNHQYNCLLADSRGLMWFGTQDGLYVWDERVKKLQSFHTDDGLINNSVLSIIEDANKEIWVSTSNGVSQIKIGLVSGKNHFSFTSFNRYDGVIQNEFLERSSYITNNGYLLLGGIDGFNEIELKNISISRKKLNPVFVNFQLFGKEITPNGVYAGNKILDQSIAASKKLTLKYNQNFFTIGFSALNYVNPSQTYYQYYLEGVDNSWHEEAAPDGVGHAAYTNLLPGTYLFKVRAADNDKDWTGKIATLQIIVNPPWWKTDAALLLYLLIAFVLVYILISRYSRKIRSQRLREEKEKLDQMKFSFFTNMSHELRTPLSLILTPLEIILKKVDDIPLKTQLTGIQRNAYSLLNLVNQLLNFRRLELNGETLHLSYCNVGEDTEVLCQAFDDLAKSKGITFKRNCLKVAIWLYLDKDKFAMMLNNLLSNAFKFTPGPGVITLTIERTQLPELLTEAISISVADTGKGIAEQDLPEIFNRFFQSHNQDDENTGSGIGLHLVKEYTLLHQGLVMVNSEQNKGSVFTLYIPLSLTPEPQLTAILPDILKHNGAIKILVAEDNDEFRSFLFSQLSLYYDVILSPNGRDALEKGFIFLPDLIISDIMMPEMNGLELCEQLKKDVRTSHIPLILLTARSAEDIRYQGFQARADAYIAKPFNLDILLIRIRNFIEQQEQRKELFRKAIIIQPSQVTSSAIDEKLISNLNLPATKIKPQADDGQEQLKTMDENERDHIVMVLNRCNWKIYGEGGAAEILHINGSTLSSRMKKLGIEKKTSLRTPPN